MASVHRFVGSGSFFLALRLLTTRRSSSYHHHIYVTINSCFFLLLSPLISLPFFSVLHPNQSLVMELFKLSTYSRRNPPPPPLHSGWHESRKENYYFLGYLPNHSTGLLSPLYTVRINRLSSSPWLHSE